MYQLIYIHTCIKLLLSAELWDLNTSYLFATMYRGTSKTFNLLESGCSLKEAPAASLYICTVYTFICIHIHNYMYIYIQLYIYICIFIYMYIYIQKKFSRLESICSLKGAPAAFLYMYSSHIYIYINTYIHNIYTYTFIYSYLYLYMYVHINI
jgi:hypothetical protein